MIFTYNNYVRIWAGEWRCESLSCQFSFLAKNIDQEGATLMTTSDLKSLDHLLVGPDVGDRSAAGRCMRSIERSRVESLTYSRLDLHRDASASCGAITHAQSDKETVTRLEVRCRHLAAPCSLLLGRFSCQLTEENWQERLKQRHSPAQIYTLCEIHFPVEFPF